CFMALLGRVTGSTPGPYTTLFRSLLAGLVDEEVTVGQLARGVGVVAADEVALADHQLAGERHGLVLRRRRRPLLRRLVGRTGLGPRSGRGGRLAGGVRDLTDRDGDSALAAGISVAPEGRANGAGLTAST